MEHWGTAAGIVILIVSGYQIHNRGGYPRSDCIFWAYFLTLLFGGYFTLIFSSPENTGAFPEYQGYH